MISIIALLIALLLPAIGQARNVANKALCMSNMKQIGVGLELFVEDHKKYPIPDRDRYDYLVTDPNSINSGGVPRIETGLSPILYHGYLRLSMVFYSPAHQEFPILRQWYGPNFASAEPPYSRAGGYCYTPHASGESNWSIDDLRDAPGPLIWDTPPDFIEFFNGGLFPSSFYAHIHEDGWHGWRGDHVVRWVPDDPDTPLFWSSGLFDMDELFHKAR